MNYIIRLLRKEKCDSLFEFLLDWILIGFAGLALVVCVVIGLVLSYLEMFGCYIVRLVKNEKL